MASQVVFRCSEILVIAGRSVFGCLVQATRAPAVKSHRDTVRPTCRSCMDLRKKECHGKAVNYVVANRQCNEAPDLFVEALVCCRNYKKLFQIRQDGGVQRNFLN